MHAGVVMGQFKMPCFHIPFYNIIHVYSTCMILQELQIDTVRASNLVQRFVAKQSVMSSRMVDTNIFLKLSTNLHKIIAACSTAKTLILHVQMLH